MASALSASAVFKRFEAYDFDGDATFQAGLPRVMQMFLAQNLRGAQLDREVQRFKAFYFSKTVAPLDFAAFVEWERSKAAVSRSSEPVCPFTGAVGKMPSSHPPIADVKAAVQAASEPRCPMGYTAARPAAVTAVGDAEHLQLTRSKTGLAHVRLVITEPEQVGDPATVATLGGHLLTCLFDRTVTALVLSFSISEATARTPLFDCGRDPSLELWSMAHGPVATEQMQQCLQNELRLLTLLEHLAQSIPTVALVDGPLYGLAVPLVLACKFRVGSQRIELRLGGSSLVGGSLGLLSRLPAGMRRYISLASKALFAADLCAAQLLTDFVPRGKHSDLEKGLAAAAACPAPNTDKALCKTIKDMIDAPGPSRLRTFEKTIEDVFGHELPSVEEVLRRLRQLPNTPWQEATLDLLAARSGPLQQFALGLLDETAALGSTGLQAAHHYQRITGIHAAAKIFDDRSSAFDLPSVAATDAPPRPVSSWLFTTVDTPSAVDWRQLIAAGDDNGPAVLLEQPFYCVQALQYTDEADDILAM